MTRQPRKQEKSPMEKYTFKMFLKQFPNDEACLEWLKNKRWPDGIFCQNCQKVTGHSYTASRKCYTCYECGLHVHPTAGTIFHKSSTSLTTWFYVAFLLAQTRGGISAKQIQRETGVTYKTAWRICTLIRQQLDEDKSPFGGENQVEVDETYYGSKTKEGKRGRGSENKTPVIGVVERRGRIHTEVIANAKKDTLQPIIEKTVQPGTTINTDEWLGYVGLRTAGFRHEVITHKLGVYVMNTVHTQTIDGFWGNFKMGIKGTHHHVSNKYLQRYLNEHAFRYNHRNDVKPMFLSFLDRFHLPSEHLNE